MIEEELLKMLRCRLSIEMDDSSRTDTCATSYYVTAKLVWTGADGAEEVLSESEAYCGRQRRD